MGGEGMEGSFVCPLLGCFPQLYGPTKHIAGHIRIEDGLLRVTRPNQPRQSTEGRQDPKDYASIPPGPPIGLQYAMQYEIKTKCKRINTKDEATRKTTKTSRAAIRLFIAA